MEDILLIQAHLKAHIGNQPKKLLNKLKMMSQLKLKHHPSQTNYAVLYLNYAIILNIFPYHITNYTFNIAVCNNYTDPNMNIAGHTDDDFLSRKSKIVP